MQEGLAPVLADMAEVFHVVAAFALDEERAQGDGQEVGQLVLLGAFEAGIGQARDRMVMRLSVPDMDRSSYHPTPTQH